MNALEKWRLRLWCKRQGVDPQEIDDSLTYAENMKHLSEFVSKSPEELAKEYGRILEVMDKEVGLGERYGVIPESEDKPFLLFKSVVYVVARSVKLVQSQLGPYEKNVRFYGRYVEVTAQITEVTAIIQHLEAKGVRVQFVGSSMIYQKVWAFVPSVGWRKPDA